MSSIRSVMTILPELRAGQTVTEISAAIHDAIAAVKQHNKAAEVIVRFAVAPMTNQQLADPAVSLAVTVDTKLPKPVPDSTLFFVDDGGNLTRQPPERQGGLSFSIAGGERKEA